MCSKREGFKSNYLDVNYKDKIKTTTYDHQLIQYIFKLGSINEFSGRALDLACGTGSFKSALEGRGMTYYGVDIDNESQELNITRCNIASESLPYPDNFFEVVFFKMGIEHLTINEISKCLLEVRRCLKENGKLVVITPDWRWVYKIFYSEYTHQTPFTKESLDTALCMSNFKVEYCNTIIQLPFVWRFPHSKFIFNILSIFYPIIKKVKLIKYSKERPLLAIARNHKD